MANASFEIVVLGANSRAALTRTLLSILAQDGNMPLHVHIVGDVSGGAPDGDVIETWRTCIDALADAGLTGSRDIEVREVGPLLRAGALRVAVQNIGAQTGGDVTVLPVGAALFPGALAHVAAARAHGINAPIIGGLPFATARPLADPVTGTVGLGLADGIFFRERPLAGTFAPASMWIEALGDDTLLALEDAWQWEVQRRIADVAEPVLSATPLAVGPLNGARDIQPERDALHALGRRCDAFLDVLKTADAPMQISRLTADGSRLDVAYQSPSDLLVAANDGLAEGYPSSPMARNLRDRLRGAADNLANRASPVDPESYAAREAGMRLRDIHKTIRQLGDIRAHLTAFDRNVAQLMADIPPEPPAGAEWLDNPETLARLKRYEMATDRRLRKIIDSGKIERLTGMKAFLRKPIRVGYWRAVQRFARRSRKEG